MRNPKEDVVSPTRQWMAFCLVLWAALALLACGDSDQSAGTDGDADGDGFVCQFDTECATGQKCIDDRCQDAPLDGDVVDGDIPGDGDQSDGDVGGKPIIRCPERLDFGAAAVGDYVDKQLEIYNEGDGVLEIRQIAFALPTEDFSINYDANTLVKVSPGSFASYTVRFTPQHGYAANMPLQIASNASNSPLCTVLLQSEYKGESKLVFNPEEVLFGNVRVDDPGMDIELLICNEGTGNKVIAITGFGFRYPSSAVHFNYNTNGINPTANNPHFLNVDTCLPVTLTYDPSEATIWPQMHENAFVVYNDADNAQSRQSEVFVTGSADQFSLRVEPNPVNFGQTVVGDSRTVNLTIINQSGAPVSITDIRLRGSLSDGQCAEFSLYLGDHSGFPFDMEVEETISEIGVGYAPANAGPDQGCNLHINYQQSGTNKHTMVSLLGSGRLENERPLARVSRSANGPDIIQPIDIPPGATDAQKRITLYGDISTDPDRNYPLTYQWGLAKPSESNTVIWPSLQDAIITFTVDWPGPYTLDLVVTDSEGAKSEPKLVLINVATNQKITIDMQFTGSGGVNADLAWIAPNGTRCSRNTMTSQRSCLMGDYGSAFVSNYTSQASEGTQETIVHPGALDGAYQIQVAFTENCASWNLGWICLSTSGTNVTVRIYVDMDTEPRYTLNTSFSSSQKGQSKSWFINKVGGTWNAPTQ